MTGSAHCPDWTTAVDTLLTTLSDAVRREIIAYFERREDVEAVPVDDLLVYLDGQFSSKDSEQLRISLAHVHLPALAEEGWLAYDRDGDQVRYHGNERAKNLLREVQGIF